ncbi:NUDIX domain-containing protein [Paenibacillus sp. FSL L8-0340]|uniref:NUDIX hydrolase n=1 Tax=Paenibacillus sp. FSL L8-0340 TaxID=2954685 RepID=UPI00315901B1
MSEFRLLSVVHVIMIRNQQLLLLRRFNTGHDDGYYALPAGRLERGEGVMAAAIREVQEECGALIAPGDLEMTGVMHIKTSHDERVDFFFIAKQWSGEISNAEPHKCDDLRWFPLDRLPANLLPVAGQALDQYRQGVWFSEHGWNQQ